MEDKQPKVLNDVTHTKYKQNGHTHQTNQTTVQNERKLNNNSNYNAKNDFNGLNKHKDNDNNKLTKSCDNNSKKFAFLSQQTIPDYRPQQVNIKKKKKIALSINLHYIHFAVDRKKSKNINKSKYEIPPIASHIWSSGSHY